MPSQIPAPRPANGILRKRLGQLGQGLALTHARGQDIGPLPRLGELVRVSVTRDGDQQEAQLALLGLLVIERCLSLVKQLFQLVLIRLGVGRDLVGPQLDLVLIAVNGKTQVLQVDPVGLAQVVLPDLVHRHANPGTQEIAHVSRHELATLLLDKGPGRHAQVVLHELAEVVVGELAFVLHVGELLLAPHAEHLGLGDQVLDLFLPHAKAQPLCLCSQ